MGSFIAGDLLGMGYDFCEGSNLNILVAKKTLHSSSSAFLG
jgi:hypothetical protein